MVNDPKHIDENLFELNDIESVVIGSPFLMRHTLTQPGSLESMMRVLQNLNPCIVEIAKFETNHTSGIFPDRFSQAGNDDRIFFDMKIDEWRSIITSFGMIETELSSSALYRADLVAKHLESGKYCSCNMNRKSLVVNWKGIPIVSLSTWKSCEQRKPS
ncbi:hypothetical protein V6N13_069950 [Hibiscus sabdariffa]|uniref:Uncharacterized protein n=2 Tax=Hibiscus sabdariffa TaxID=183260 RepID=A0ABR1ZDF5_9ROSI